MTLFDKIWRIVADMDPGQSDTFYTETAKRIISDAVQPALESAVVYGGYCAQMSARGAHFDWPGDYAIRICGSGGDMPEEIAAQMGPQA